MEFVALARMVSLIRGKDGASPSAGANMAGCPVHQRVALGWLLFGRGDRHLCAESLFEEAQHARVPVSLATIYNTLNQFTQAGLLREIPLEGARTYFDTNVSHHHHFFIEGLGLTDIPARDITVSSLPSPPEGMEIERVDVVVRLRKKAL
jgi:Fur family iron response transcriptional regulator